MNQNPKLRIKRWGDVSLGTFNDIFYPPRTTEPSCFNIPALENLTLDLKPQFTGMLPKFITIGDA